MACKIVKIGSEVRNLQRGQWSKNLGLLLWICEATYDITVPMKGNVR